MFTRAVINAAASTLDATAQLMLLTALRGSAQYKSGPGLYPDLAGELAKMDGSTATRQVQAKMLNAAYDYISSEIEFGTVKLSPTNKDNTDYDNVRELEQVFEYCFNVLYDTGEATAAAPFTSAATGRSPLSSLRSPRCCSACAGVTDFSLLCTRCR